ncbi:unnamed protein product [Timema podura]|uniref:Uncharacterized protein n=1 Tax=Timema podura TaxID=61482 RepID=A0ABN7NQ17_TIMPD|nr:unnamed protein product [Timema podura]
MKCFRISVKMELEKTTIKTTCYDLRPEVKPSSIGTPTIQFSVSQEPQSLTSLISWPPLQAHLFRSGTGCPRVFECIVSYSSNHTSRWVTCGWFGGRERGFIAGNRRSRKKYNGSRCLETQRPNCTYSLFEPKSQLLHATCNNMDDKKRRVESLFATETEGNTDKHAHTKQIEQRQSVPYTYRFVSLYGPRKSEQGCRRIKAE